MEQFVNGRNQRDEKAEKKKLEVSASFFLVIHKEVSKKMKALIPEAKSFFDGMGSDHGTLLSRTSFFESEKLNPILYDVFWFEKLTDFRKGVIEKLDTDKIDIYGSVDEGGIIVIYGHVEIKSRG